MGQQGEVAVFAEDIQHGSQEDLLREVHRPVGEVAQLQRTAQLLSHQPILLELSFLLSENLCTNVRKRILEDSTQHYTLEQLPIHGLNQKTFQGCWHAMAL